MDEVPEVRTQRQEASEQLVARLGGSAGVSPVVTTRTIIEHTNITASCVGPTKSRRHP